MDKKIWRKNFEMQRVPLQMIATAMDALIKYQHRITGKTYLHEALFSMENFDVPGAYMPKDQLREFIKKTIEAIVNNPKKVRSVHRETVQLVKDYMTFSKKVLGMNLKKLSNEKLAKVYEKIIYHQKIHHGTAVATTWFVDSDGEDLSHHLMNIIKKKIEERKYNASLAEIFSVLTTPLQKSLAMIEEIESLKILKEIKKDKIAKKIFSVSLEKAEEIKNNLSKINSKLRKKIQAHYKKWNWTPYTYLGPAYELNYYLHEWRGWLKENMDVDEKIKNLNNQTGETKKEKNQIIKGIALDKKTKELFEIGAEIVFLKSFRKDGIFYGFFVLEKIFKEIALRLDLSLNQVRMMTHQEISAALKNNKVSKEELNERIKYCVFWQKDKKIILLSGKKARKFFNEHNFEKEEIIKVNELSGTPASPGIAKGKVKIINLPEEMGKMNEGDIMIAHTTFPALVPAMKKASAIVTDDGGITCHAAIVARELKTPCVVGVKIATKILKDGDRVEVDANKGIVKMIK